MNILLAMGSAVAQGMLWGIMAIGVFLTYKIMQISDLTVDGSFALGACASVAFILLGIDPVLSLILATVTGALAGLVTGLLHTKLKIPAILSGILTQIALYSINVRILGRGNVSIMKEDTVFTLLMEKLPFSRDAITALVGLIITIIIVVALYWFFGTEVGTAIRATGNNQSMAKAQGINTNWMIIIGLMVSNALVAFSGALVGQSQRFADVTMGTGTIVIGLASVVIGGVIINEEKNFSLQLMSTALGSVIYRVIIAIVLQLGLRTDDQKLLTAVIVATALSVPNLRKRVNGKSVKKEVE